MSEQKKKKASGKWDYRQWCIVSRLLVIPGITLLIGRLFTGFDQLLIPGLVMPDLSARTRQAVLLRSREGWFISSAGRQ